MTLGTVQVVAGGIDLLAGLETFPTTGRSANSWRRRIPTSSSADTDPMYRLRSTFAGNTLHRSVCDSGDYTSTSSISSGESLLGLLTAVDTG